MSDAFDILGVPANTSPVECKAAYRKLAAKHHPDRGGDTATFQSIQTAMDQIENGYKRIARPNPNLWEQFSAGRSSFNGGNPQSRAAPNNFEDFYREFCQTTGTKPKSTYGNQRITVPPLNAPWEMSVEDYTFSVDKGLPNGWTGDVTGQKTMVGQRGSRTMNVTLNMVCRHDPSMVIQGVGGVRLPYAERVGDATCVIKTNAINFITGAWVTIRDVLGQPQGVRIPAGFSPEKRMRVAGAGYYLWDSVAEKPIMDRRGDLVIEVIPEFTSVSGMTAQEITNATEIFKNA